VEGTSLLEETTTMAGGLFTRYDFDEEGLSQSLRHAAAEHHVYEEGLGHPDEDWPSWYAHEMFQEKEKERGGN
jgi:hypothetical protein